MEKEGIGYQDALRHLAAKYGIKIEERELSDEERRMQSERESMLLVNQWAMETMHRNLLETEEGRNVGLQYLYGRGITQEAIKTFRLGYAIDRGQALCHAAGKDGISIDILKKLGLVGVSSDGREYDRFRGRVIYPIFNSAGKVIAFGGRDLKGGPAKYINSPESMLYKKSNELYGMYQAKSSMVKSDRCFLVEGYMDVIGMWQSGMQNVIASSGTALTDGQIALIHRFTGNVTLIYDGDAAGIKASVRGIDMLLSHNIDIRVLLLPDGDDPDSFARKHTPEEFRRYVEEHEKDFIRFKTEVLLSESSEDPLKRTAAVKSIVQSIAAISDKVKRAAYIRECSRLLEIGEEILAYETDKLRAGIVEKITRERERKEVSVPTTITPASRDRESDRYGQLASSSLDALEKKVIYYCIKYGMLDYGEGVDIDGNVKSMNVVETVNEDMEINGFGFSNPLYTKIFTIILGLNETFRKDYDDFRSHLDEEISTARESGINEIAAKGLDMDGIEAEERKLNEKLQNHRDSEEYAYCRDYVTQILISHEDDEIRKFSIAMVSVKYKLSKYHSKLGRVETEEDRLPDLLNRALNEWKQGILNAELSRLLQEMSEAQNQGDYTRISEIQANILEVERIRREFASSTGDRVIIPKTTHK